jgi:anti-sigma regulatory factor (Ser/Thr protein kinase)
MLNVSTAAAGARPDYAPERVVADYNLPLETPPDASVFLADAQNLPALRQFSAAHAAVFGLRGQHTADLVLAVTELVTNSVEHGGGTATVAMFAVDGHVICQIRDAGPLETADAGPQPPTPRRYRGHGLLMVNTLADLVRIHSSVSGTTVEARFPITPPG